MLEPLIKIAVLLGGLMTAAAYFVLLERWIAAWVQDRLGPNRVGVPLTRIRLFGLGQPMADGGKFILKEEFMPAHVDKRLFLLAPISILAAALAVFAVIPFGSVLPASVYTLFGQDAATVASTEGPVPLVVAPGVDVGLLYVFALSSIAVYGVIVGGWASNNKYSFLGGLRSSAQLISYELPLGLAILSVVLASGSMNLDEIVHRQADSGVWFIFTQPLGFVVFVIAAFAEAARLPFDLPECEQELIGGYHTEYTGMKLLLFLVAEFLHMITAAFLIVLLFLGGWHIWGLAGPDEQVTWVGAVGRLIVLHLKVTGVIVFFMVVRWSWPRFRFDQLMALAWKVMLPLGMINLVAVAIFEELSLALQSQLGGWTLAISLLGSWLVCLGAWFGVAYATPMIGDNRVRKDIHTYEVDPQI